MLYKKLVLLTIVFLTFPAFATVPNEISINGVVHYKAYESLNNPNQFIEYIPKGEKLDSWSSLVGIYHFAYVQDAQLFAKNIEEKVKEKNQGKALGIELIENSPQHIVQTYVLWDLVDKSQVVEQNAWRYKKIANIDGMMAIQYAARTYLPQSQTPKVDEMKPIPAKILEELKKLPIDEYKF